MTVAQLEHEIDMSEFVNWLGFYRYRDALRERDRKKDELVSEAKQKLKGRRH